MEVVVLVEAVVEWVVVVVVEGVERLAVVVVMVFAVVNVVLGSRFCSGGGSGGGSRGRCCSGSRCVNSGCSEGGSKSCSVGNGNDSSGSYITYVN